MADMLTHVLVAYTVLTVVGWRVDWLDRCWVVVGMCGSVAPDLNRIELLLGDRLVREALGVPFTWSVFQTLGGLALLAGAVAVLFGERRRRAYVALLGGGGTHVVLDGLRTYADGSAGFLWYPVWWRPPTPNLYVSADWWPAVLAVVLAAIVYGLDSGALRRCRDRLGAERRGG